MVRQTIVIINYLEATIMHLSQKHETYFFRRILMLMISDYNVLNKNICQNGSNADEVILTRNIYDRHFEEVANMSNEY